ncbi:MAG TPA: hypothetical protein DD471_14085 [Planctomycetes bacterium]|jgi:hypothetical protein|nr:hypothetical protein [Planctomycetota bacterium]
MLDKIEKIIYGICGVALLGVSVLYAWRPVPDTDPREFIPDSVITTAPPKKLTTPKEGSKQTPLTANKKTAEKNNIKDKLNKALIGRRISAKDIQVKYMQIQKRSFDFIKNESNWLPELKMAGSRVKISKKDFSHSLELTNIKEGSLLRSVVGLESGDTIELINGERWEFTGENTLNYRTQALEMIDKIQAGGSFSLTITRDNAPQHLTFSLLE